MATASVTTPRGEPTTLRFNTYAAGDPDLTDDLFTIDGPGTIESTTTRDLGGTLPPGEYELTATAAPSGLTDTATATLRSRSTNGLSVYSTAGSAVTDFSTSDLVKNAIANGTLTPAATITDGDTVVYAVDAAGLAGYASIHAPALETGTDLDRLDGLEFAVTTAAAPGSNSTRVATANGTTIHSHETGLFLVANATETLGEAVTATGKTDLAATFDVVDDRLRTAAGPNASHSESAPFTYARAAIDDDAATDPDGASDSTDGTDDSTDAAGDPADSVGDSTDATGGSADGADSSTPADSGGTSGPDGSGGTDDSDGSESTDAANGDDDTGTDGDDTGTDGDDTGTDGDDTGTDGGTTPLEDETADRSVETTTGSDGSTGTNTETEPTGTSRSGDETGDVRSTPPTGEAPIDSGGDPDPAGTIGEADDLG
ncbi:hypothetical protein, partial [Halorubrum halodurans]